MASEQRSAPTVETTPIDGLVIIRTKQLGDDRGLVRELYRESDLVALGVEPLERIAQANLTATRQGAVRGMHAEEVTKQVSVVAGEAFCAWVDMRDGSPTSGAVHTQRLAPGLVVRVPRGVGNGFQATAPGITEYLYVFDEEWRPGMAGRAVTPLDPELAIPWPLPIDPADRSAISEKDATAPTWEQLTRADH